MWQVIGQTKAMAMLQRSLERGARSARGTMGWDQDYLDEQTHRLRDARAHCDLYLPTDGLSEEEVLARVVEFLRGRIRRVQQDAGCET